MSKLPFVPFLTKHKKLIIVILIILIALSFLLFLFQSFTMINSIQNFSSLTSASKQADANNTISAYVKETISPEKVPITLASQPAKLYDGTNANPSLFTTSWELSDGTTGQIINASKKDDSNDYIFTTFSQSNKISQLTPSSAASVTAQYFILKPQGQWQCKTIQTGNNQNAILCENFWTESNTQTKKGIGVINNGTIFSCTLFAGNTLSSWTSCSEGIGETL